jgi:hypothetical protein
MRHLDFFQAGVGCHGLVCFRGTAGSGAGGLKTSAFGILHGAGRCCQFEMCAFRREIVYSGNAVFPEIFAASNGEGLAVLWLS